MTCRLVGAHELRPARLRQMDALVEAWLPGSEGEGGADPLLAARPTRASCRSSGRARSRERFPWLDNEGEDDREDPDGFSVYAGTARYFGHEGNWFQAADGDPAAARRSPNDPLWIVEALAVVDGVGRPRPGRELVRGASCRRAPYIVDPHAHATELEVPAPYPLLGRLTDAAAGLSHRLTGEVWIGDEGRIHRVSWTRIVVRRARWPFKAPQHRLWQTTELWDFGVAVDIEIPSPQPEEKIRIGEVVEATGSLWRRKRAYERRTKSR